jgi:hypothetical protein
MLGRWGKESLSVWDLTASQVGTSIGATANVVSWNFVLIHDPTPPI